MNIRGQELSSLFVQYVGHEEYLDDIEFIIKEYIAWHSNTDSILPIWSPEAFIAFFITLAEDYQDEEDTINLKATMEANYIQIKQYIYDSIERLKKDIIVENNEELKCDNKFFLQVLIDYIVHNLLLSELKN